MSIQRRQRKGGPVYRVQWRDEQGRQRSKTFTKKRDAEAFEAKVKLAKRQGELAGLDAGRQTLKAFSEEWWELHAETSLAPKTRRLYRWLLDTQSFASPRARPTPWPDSGRNPASRS